MENIRSKRQQLFALALEDPRPARLISFLTQRDYEITVFSDALTPTANLVHVKLDAHFIRNSANILFKIIVLSFIYQEKFLPLIYLEIG